MWSISENLSPKMKGQGHHLTKYGQNYSFGSITEFRCTKLQSLSMENIYWSSVQGSKFFNQKNFVGAELSICENLRYKGQGHHMTKYGKMLF